MGILYFLQRFGHFKQLGGVLAALYHSVGYSFPPSSNSVALVAKALVFFCVGSHWGLPFAQVFASCAAQGSPTVFLELTVIHVPGTGSQLPMTHLLLRSLAMTFPPLQRGRLVP